MRWQRVDIPLHQGATVACIRFDGALIRAMLRIGVPSSLAMLSLAIAEIVLLGWINRYGYTPRRPTVRSTSMTCVQLPAMSLGITATILARMRWRGAYGTAAGHPRTGVCLDWRC